MRLAREQYLSRATRFSDRAHTSAEDIIVEICALAESQSFFLVLPNNLPETFRGAQTCRSVVVRVGDAGMGVVQKRAGEIGVLAALAVWSARRSCPPFRGLSL